MASRYGNGSSYAVEELSCRVGALEVNHANMDSDNVINQTKNRESYTFLMKGITSMEDLVELKLYQGKCYDYVRLRFKSELIYPVVGDDNQTIDDDDDLRQGLFGELLLTSMMSDVRRLAEKYENPRQSPGQVRIVLRFGHLHWGARGLTNHKLTYGDLLEELNQYIKRKENRPPFRSDRGRGRNNGASRGQQRGRGRGQAHRYCDGQRQHNDSSNFTLPDKCIQSVFFHPGGQKTEVFEKWLRENGFELEDFQERVVCNFVLRENNVECILMLDRNLSILYCRLNKTRWNSINIKTVEPGKPDIRINLETIRALDRVQLTTEKGLEKVDFKRPILEFEGGNSNQPFIDRKVIVPDHPDGQVKFVRLRQRKIYRFGNNDNTETSKYAALRNVRITVGTVREYEKFDETSKEFEIVNETQPEVTVTLTELPDWNEEDEWQNLVWTFYQFGSAIADKLEFAESEGSVSPGPSKEPASVGNLSQLFSNITQENDAIFTWIETHVSPEERCRPAFVRDLTTALCAAAIKGGEHCSVDGELIKKRSPILCKYLNHKTLELHALYALQALVHRLDHPQGVLSAFFNTLYDCNVISEDAFFQWDTSEDSAEKNGRGAAKMSVVQFFTWLREADEEPADG